jgi:hypothetical protein
MESITLLQNVRGNYFSAIGRYGEVKTTGRTDHFAVQYTSVEDAERSMRRIGLSPTVWTAVTL